ncbi:MAG: mevalonate kinase [Caldilinea sp.]|nr:mevalonate kinase [Caldilinea sp.]MDW8440905.1 mevalonate kinase [Caldilineaceae bacterium]
MTTANAPGKIILIGEHAVVYGRPAIAAPVWQCVATAVVASAPPGSGVTISAMDIHRRFSLDEVGEDEPLAVVVRATLAHLGVQHPPDLQIELHSDIPIAGGLGSGAALSTALVRALFAHFGQVVEPEVVSAIVYESERLYHGAPSGIDNTVVAFGQPIWFIKGKAAEPLRPAAPLTLVIADSGVPSPTKETVGAVRRLWERETERCEVLFDEIAVLAQRARLAIEQGDRQTLGRLFDADQTLLEALGVSSETLDRLILAARRAGALGAKLSGGGRGGNIIALVEPERVDAVSTALKASGARRIIVTQIERRSPPSLPSRRPEARELR